MPNGSEHLSVVFIPKCLVLDNSSFFIRYSSMFCESVSSVVD